MVTEYKTRALSASMIAISSVIVVEGSAGLLIGSLALITDAAHAGFDAISTLILLLATRWSLRPPDEDHTYGHGKIEAVGGQLGGIALLLLSGILFYESLMRLLAPPKILIPGILGFGAALYTISIDFFRIGVLGRAMRRGRSITIRADFLHAVSDLSSTLLALAGLVLASYGIYRGDAVASMILSLMLAYLSSRLVYGASRELTDAIPSNIVQAIRRTVLDTEGVCDCKQLQVRRVGSRTFVDAVITVPLNIGLENAHAIASRLEEAVSRRLGETTVVVHIEPEEQLLSTEELIKIVASETEGVSGIHNLNVARTQRGLYVTLHIQVDAEMPLSAAHSIAEELEEKLKERVVDLRHVTVHIESLTPEISSGEVVVDDKFSRTITRIADEFPQVKRTSRITTYTSDGRLYINVSCSLDGKTPVDTVHDVVTKLEQKMRDRFKGAVVTVHPEPA